MQIPDEQKQRQEYDEAIKVKLGKGIQDLTYGRTKESLLFE
jgi:hypothetical protein